MMFRLNLTISYCSKTTLLQLGVEARPVGRNVADTINYSLASLNE